MLEFRSRAGFPDVAALRHPAIICLPAGAPPQSFAVASTQLHPLHPLLQRGIRCRCRAARTRLMNRPMEAEGTADGTSRCLMDRLMDL